MFRLRLVGLLLTLLAFALAAAAVYAQLGDSQTASGVITAAPAPVMPVAIDIKPGSDPNSTNLASHGVIPVAILTTDTFDATTVDPATVDFEGALAVHHSVEDVDGDGDLDLIMHFRTQETAIADAATEACLTGETIDGQAIKGCDDIRIVPPELDSDGDGFGDAVEASLRTDQFAACPSSAGHDAWPSDMNANDAIAINDVTGPLAPHFSAIEGVDATGTNPGDYNPRVDLNRDGVIAINDITGPFAPDFGKSCT